MYECVRHTADAMCDTQTLFRIQMLQSLSLTRYCFGHKRRTTMNAISCFPLYETRKSHVLVWCECEYGSRKRVVLPHAFDRRTFYSCNRNVLAIFYRDVCVRDRKQRILVYLPNQSFSLDLAESIRNV